MERRTEVQKIAILGHVGNGNLGDEAIIAAIIQGVRRRCPAAELSAFTSNPVDTRERHKIPAFPIRRPDRDSRILKQPRLNRVDRPDAKRHKTPYERIKICLKTFPRIYHLLTKIDRTIRVALNCLKELSFLVRAFNALKRKDLLVIAGSNQLFDYFGGSWGFPYTLFKWSILAKIARTRVVFLSVGAGPIASPLSRFFIKYSLSLANYRSYRDMSSRKLIEEIGVSESSSVFPDLAFGLRGVSSVPPSTPKRSAPIVGINPMPFFTDYYWPEVDQHVYQDYIGKLASFALWLIQEGYAILFFPTQLRADPSVISDIKLLMTKTGTFDFEHQIIEQSFSTLEDLLCQISLTEIVIATRFHAILIAYAMHKPVLGISYHKKIDDLMADMDQSEYVLDITSFNRDLLIDRFTLLKAKSNLIKAHLQRKIVDYQNALDRQYDQIFSLR